MITQKVNCIMSCGANHDHGPGVLTLTWDENDPLAVKLHVESDVIRNSSDAVTERDTLGQCVAYGDDGTQIYGTGRVTYKIKGTEPDYIVFQQPYYDDITGHVLMRYVAEVLDVGAFLSRTYDVVAQGCEFTDSSDIELYRLLYS